MDKYQSLLGCRGLDLIAGHRFAFVPLRHFSALLLGGRLCCISCGALRHHNIDVVVLILIVGVHDLLRSFAGFVRRCLLRGSFPAFALRRGWQQRQSRCGERIKVEFEDLDHCQVANMQLSTPAVDQV